MTVSNTVNLVSHSGDGAASVFPYTFTIPLTADLLVIHIDASNVRTELSPSVYSVTGIGVAGGGNVTYPLSGPLMTSSERLVISRQVSETQTVDLINNAAYLPEVLETALDKLTFLSQQTSNRISRSLTTVEGDEFTGYIPAKAALANKTMAFDGSGEPIVGPAITDIENAGASASAAASSASAASTSASNAGTSETNAAASETAAGVSETNAAASESAASVSEGNAATSAATATTKAGEAVTSASNASTSETNAATSETNAGTSETNAGVSETNAASSETAAGISEANSAASESAAAASAASINFPDPGVALNMVRRNAGNTAWENRTPAQVLADIAPTITDDGGNVGVGEPTPLAKMQISGPNNGDVFYLTSTDVPDDRGLMFSNSSNGLIWDINAKGAAGAFGQIALSTNGIERARIDASGNVGIGSTNPAAFGKFVVQGTGTLQALNASSGVATQGFFENGVGRAYLKTLNGVDGLAFVDADGSTERMRIDASGNFGINVTPAYKLDVSNGSVTGLVARFARGGVASEGGIYVDTTSVYYGNVSSSNAFIVQNTSDYAYIRTNNLERMRITSAGNVGIGNTAPADILEIGDFSSIGSTQGSYFTDTGARRGSSANTTATAYHNTFYNPNGLVGSITSNGTTITYATTSDYRLKVTYSEILDATALDKIMQLPIYNGAMKKNPLAMVPDPTIEEGSEQLLLLAHEVKAIFPHLVTGDKDEVDINGDPVWQQMDYAKLAVPTIAAIQELKRKQDSLEARLAALEAV